MTGLARPVLLALAALPAAACYRGYAVEGILIAADGRRGVSCAVTVAEPRFAEGAGHDCSSPEMPPTDATGPFVVPTGSRFRCVVSYGAAIQHLRVRCPGYVPVEQPIEGCDSDCGDVDLGAIMVQPEAWAAGDADGGTPGPSAS